MRFLDAINITMSMTRLGAIFILLLGGYANAQPMENVNIPGVGLVSSSLGISPNGVRTSEACQSPSRFPAGAVVTAPFYGFVKATKNNFQSIDITHDIRMHSPNGEIFLIQPSGQQMVWYGTEMCFDFEQPQALKLRGWYMWDFMINGYVIGRLQLDVGQY